MSRHLGAGGFRFVRGPVFAWLLFLVVAAVPGLGQDEVQRPGTGALTT